MHFLNGEVDGDFEFIPAAKNKSEDVTQFVIFNYSFDE